MCIRTRPSKDNSDKSSACTRQSAQQGVVIVYLTGPHMLATIGVFSMSHWRNDYNHEPLILLLRPRQLLPLSIQASATLRLNSIAIIKTPLLLSPTQQRENQPRTPALRQPRPPTQHSPVPSLIYSSFTSYFVGPSAAPYHNSIGLQTSSTHTLE